MTKVLRCKDAGVDCDWVGCGETEEEVLKQAAEHAKKDHGFEEFPPELIEKARSMIRDE